MPATHCTGCGKRLVGVSDDLGGDLAAADRCPGCARPIDPPRYCPDCGRWLAVTVTPTGWTARCREHGETGPGQPPT